MHLVIENLPEAIRTTKQELRAALPEYKEVFREVEDEMRKRVGKSLASANPDTTSFPLSNIRILHQGKFRLNLPQQ